MNFAQIELNISVVDNAHTIESVALGIENILKLDNLGVMAMATNKEGKCKILLQKFLLIIVQENLYMIRLLGK